MTLPPQKKDPDLASRTGRLSLRETIVVWTRPTEGRDPLAEALTEAGAQIVFAPVLEIRSLTGPKSLELFLMSLDHLHQWRGWLILPSPNAVRHFSSLMTQANLAPGALTGVRFAVMGRGSAEALQKTGIAPDFLAPEAFAASLASALPAQLGTPVLIAGSARSRPELQDGLRERGMRVQLLALYDVAPFPKGLQAVEEALTKHSGPVLAMASPSAVEAVLDHLSEAGPLRDKARWLAIGPATYQRMIDSKISPGRAAYAVTPDGPGLVAAARAVLASSPRGEEALS